MSSQLSPPAGGDQNQIEALVGMTIAMLSLSVIMVALRFIVRLFVVKSMWWDDWAILMALVGTAIGAGLDFAYFNYGFGRHRYYIDGPSYDRIQYYIWGDWIQIFATLMWTKISICLFLARIPATKSLRRPLYAAVGILFISNLILTLLWIFQCLPVNSAWDLTVPGKCFSKNQLLQIILAQGLISAISDFTLAAYPILILFRVQISLRKKIGLYLLMSLGTITGACCIVRSALNWGNESPDATWDAVPNYMWRCLEINFGIAAACIPAVYPGYRALQRLFRNYRSRQSSEKTGSEKDRAWLNLEQHTQRTGVTARAMAPGALIDPDVPIPEASILKMTEFGVHPESMPQSPSDDQPMEGPSGDIGDAEAESPREAARRTDLANLEREESQQLSISSNSKPNTAASWV